EHARPRVGEPPRRRRACGPAADHEYVEALHKSQATIRRHQGGVPERPKGTGCKPVGSAYGGSNPPAPIFRRADEFRPIERSKSVMRKVVLYELLSLDGVAEAPDTFFTDWDDAMDANLAAVIGTQDAVILGRRSYDDWSQFWPNSEIEPFATFINGVAKYVASSTPLDRQWHNATAIDGGLVEFVQDLKRTPGGD